MMVLCFYFFLIKLNLNFTSSLPLYATEQRTILLHDNAINIPPTTLLHQHTTEHFLPLLSNHIFPFLQLLRTNMKMQFLETILMFCSAVVRLAFSLSS